VTDDKKKRRLAKKPFETQRGPGSVKDDSALVGEKWRRAV